MGGKSLRKCEVCGIRRVRRSYSGIFLARFPLDPARCRLWVKLTGNEDLAYLPIQRLNENKFICGNHFAKTAFNKKINRLKRNAIPSLNLNTPLTDEILLSFPISVPTHEKSSKDVSVEVQGELTGRKRKQGVENDPRCSKRLRYAEHNTQELCIVRNVEQKINNAPECALSTSKETICEKSNKTESCSPKVTNENDVPIATNENDVPKVTNEDNKSFRVARNIDLAEMSLDDTTDEDDVSMPILTDDTDDEDDPLRRPTSRDDESDKTDATSETERLLSPDQAESVRSPPMDTEWLEIEKVFIPIDTELLLSPTETESMLNPIETESVLTPDKTPVGTKSVPTHLKTVSRPIGTKTMLTLLKIASRLTPVPFKSVPTHLKTALMRTPVGTKSVRIHLKTVSKGTPVGTKSAPPIHLKTLSNLTPVGTKSAPTLLKTASKLTFVGTKSAPTLLKTASNLTPFGTKSAPTLLKTASNLTPVGTKSAPPIHLKTVSNLTPVGTKLAPTLLKTASKLTPVASESVSTHFKTASKLTSVTTKSLVTPVGTKSMLTPMETEPMLAATKIESVLANKMCRICLDRNKTLQELNKRLTDYFLEICRSTIPSPNLMSCNTCAEALKTNLDFRNKCRKANKMFENWNKDLKVIKNKRSAKSRSIVHDNRIIENMDVNTDSKPTEHLFVNDKGDVCKVDVNKTTLYVNKVTTEAIQNEINTFPFPVDNEVVVQTYSDNQVGKRVVEDEKRDGRNNKENEMAKSKEKAESGTNDKKYGARRMYKQREIAKRSEFTQYKSVFDVQLFDTYADARRELESRRHSEPYLSARYKCNVCYTVYKSNGLLQFHMKWHDSSPELCHECDVCAMRFATRSTLLKHKPACHRAKFTCKMCPLVTYQRQAMKSHFEKHQGKIFKCHCNRVFNHKSSYLTHKRIAHASKHVCVTCARTFVSQLGLQYHRLRMHQTVSNVDNEVEASVRCAPCGLTFPSRQVHTVHVLNTEAHKDAAAGMIACSLCGEEFESAVQVTAHKRSYHKQFMSKVYKRPLVLEPKVNQHISEDYQCKLCGTAGTGRMWLYRHYQRHHTAQQYDAPRAQRTHLCDQCGKPFYLKVKLNEHKLVHSGVMPFRCEICSKLYRTKTSLKKHLERHGPPQHECPQCGKMFKGSSNLYNHIRSHTGDRRFVCACCGKGFLHRAAMREHVRAVHLQIRRQKKHA